MASKLTIFVCFRLEPLCILFFFSMLHDFMLGGWALHHFPTPDLPCLVQHKNQERSRTSHRGSAQ